MHACLSPVVPNFMFINTSQDARKNDLEPQDVSGINFFEMHIIRTATNNFSSSNKLGQGGFGPVYKVWDTLFLVTHYLHSAFL